MGCWENWRFSLRRFFSLGEDAENDGEDYDEGHAEGRAEGPVSGLHELILDDFAEGGLFLRSSIG